MRTPEIAPPPPPRESYFKASLAGPITEMARISISTSPDLDTILSSITEDTVTASIHWELCKDLWASIPAFATELSQSRAFWSLTMNAHRQVTLFRLGRLYDQQRNALSLPSLLASIAANVHLFDEPHFRTRLKGNAFVDSLAQTARRPDGAVLGIDAADVSAQANDTVKKLVELRNRVFAHVDPRVVLGTLPNPAEAFDVAETDLLLGRAASIVNRYGSLFKATTSSMRIAGHDDFKQVLLAVRRDSAAHETILEEELAACRAHSTQ